MGKGGHLSLDHRSWHTNTLGLVVCTNKLPSKDAYIHTYIHNAYIRRLYNFFVKCRHLSLDCRSWRRNTLGFAVCTNTLGVSSHRDEEEEDDDDILIFFAHKILTIAIDLCCRSSSNNQLDDSSWFAERRGNFLQKKLCKRRRSRGCPSVEIFFSCLVALRGFSCVVVLFFSLFFFRKNSTNHQCS